MPSSGKIGRNMKSTSDVSYWLVGAYDNGSNVDNSSEFIQKGIWINGYDDRYLDQVRSMKVGDRIGIKSTYTQIYDVPFENNGLPVSVMAIKAIGTITHNLGDGKNILVQWEPDFQAKKWYFYTYRNTVWKLAGDDKEYMSDLIDFVFSDLPQDLQKFRNDPYWRDRFGDKKSKVQQFAWTTFYGEMANAILQFKNDRKGLLEIMRRAAAQVDALNIPTDHYLDGKTGPWRDICPFTFLGLFNKGLTNGNRHRIAQALADELGVKTPAPTEFPGIPVLNNMKSWFFRFENLRIPGDIDKLWDLFESALSFADGKVEESTQLIEAFDRAQTVSGVKWNITFGMYWIRPWTFVPLDQNSRALIINELRIPIIKNADNDAISGQDYVNLLESLTTNFLAPNYLVHSFPELTLKAWGSAASPTPDPDEEEPVRKFPPSIPIEQYGIKEIVEDGSFLSSEELESILRSFRAEKNLILQGPPGTGKTWLAKRMAQALIGTLTTSNIISMQFHSNLSYEDFVRGWRPVGDGTLALSDGPFLELVDRAIRNPEAKFVFVIEEINRGNPAQVFGEMLTLLEADKRGPNEALQMTYRKSIEELIFIPENLFVIGTMNTADRSLALLDFALRRRFAWETLKPTFNNSWKSWLLEQFSIPIYFSTKLGNAIDSLNTEIAEDQNLGSSYLIGQSFFTPPKGQIIGEPVQWAIQVIEKKIYPTLREYWYDDLKNADAARDNLIKALV